jgi:hypothetical protein
MWQHICALDRMANGIDLMIKLNIDNWGFACTLQTHEKYGDDDDDDDVDDDDDDDDDDGKIKGKFHPRTGHEGPEGE